MTTPRKLAVPNIRMSDVKVTEAVLKALKENVELLTRQRGTNASWAVTFQDLVDLGLVTQEEVNEHLQTHRGA